MHFQGNQKEDGCRVQNHKMQIEDADRGFCLLVFGLYPAKLRDHSWYCTQELLLVVFTGPYGIPRIGFRLGVYKARASL